MNENKIHGYRLASKWDSFVASLVEGILFTILLFAGFLLFGKYILEYCNSDFTLIECCLLHHC